MLKQIQFGHVNYYLEQLHTSFLNFVQQGQTNRIKEIAFDAFTKLSAFFRSFNNQSKEINMKPIAMISCLSLITLLIISIFRRREESIILPPTPMKRNEARG